MLFLSLILNRLTCSSIRRNYLYYQSQGQVCMYIRKRPFCYQVYSTPTQSRKPPQSDLYLRRICQTILCYLRSIRQHESYGDREAYWVTDHGGRKKFNRTEWLSMCTHTPSTHKHSDPSHQYLSLELVSQLVTLLLPLPLVDYSQLSSHRNTFKVKLAIPLPLLKAF